MALKKGHYLMLLLDLVHSGNLSFIFYIITEVLRKDNNTLMKKNAENAHNVQFKYLPN